MKTIGIGICLIIFTLVSQGQPWLKNLPAGKSRQELTLNDYRKAFHAYWEPYLVQDGYYMENGVKKKAAGWKHFRRWEYDLESKVTPSDGKLPVKDAASILREYAADNPQIPLAAWTPLGPSLSAGGYAGIGRLNCIAFHPSDLNTWWVGAASGGLWVTGNNGSTWSCLTDANGALAVSDIAIPPDFSVSQTIYIATGDKDHWDNHSVGVLKSTDAGASWMPTGISYTLADADMVYRLLMDPSDPQILIAATSNGVYKTLDGGVNWNTFLYSQSFIDMEYKPGDFNTLYGSTTDGRIFVSSDGGSSWSETAIDPDARRIELAVSPHQPGWLYALVAAGNSGLFGIYKSTNSGGSFTQVFSGGTLNLLGWDSDGGDSGGQGWYDLSLAVSPTNANTLLVGGINTWRSTNGGAAWSIVNHWWGDGVPAAHADKHWLTYRNNGDLFECNDGGVYLSPDNGTSWSDKSNGMVISQMYKLGVSATASGEVITGLQDNGTKLLSGGNWLDVKGGDGMECLIDYTNVNIQYGTYVNGQISRTTNHWGSSTNIQPAGAGSGAWVTPYIIDPVNPQTLYAGYADVWKTTNRGTSWTKISTMNTAERIRSLAIAPSNTQVLYAADPFVIWKTTNGGSSWSDITGTLPTSSGTITTICVKHDDPATLWVGLGGYSNDRIYMSTNGGNSWSAVSTGLPPVPVYSIVQNKQSTSEVQLYAGTETGVYLKKGDAPWASFNSGLPNVKIGEIEIWYSTNAQNSKLRAATYGRGLWETPVHYSPAAMSYTSSTSSHPVTATVPPGSENQVILRIEVVTNGDLSPLTATSFTFSTDGSDNPGINLSRARLFFTGSSNLFATANPFGAQVIMPSGTFTITGTETLNGGSNFFWLAYDLPSGAVRGNVVDAQCHSITVGTPKVPSVTSPAGNRKIAVLFCQASSTICDEYIKRVMAGSLDNSTNCSGGGYGDYTHLSADISPGNTLAMEIHNQIGYTGDQCGVWVDWNANGDFSDDAPVGVVNGPWVYNASISCPSDAQSGPRRMRIRIHYTDEPTQPCGVSYYGEVEDYTLMVNPPINSIVSGNIGFGDADCFSAWQILQVAGSGNPFTVENGGNARLVAGLKIIMLPETRVHTGGYLHARISPTAPWCIPPGTNDLITGMLISAENDSPVSFLVFPNPGTGIFNLRAPAGTETGDLVVTVYHSNGREVLKKNISGHESPWFSLEDQPAGLYIVRITTSSQSIPLKVIKQ